MNINNKKDILMINHDSFYRSPISKNRLYDQGRTCVPDMIKKKLGEFNTECTLLHLENTLVF